MWNLIPKRRMPPSRLVRYCCQFLKESQGRDNFVITGVRWDESVNRRARRAGLEYGDTLTGERTKTDPDNPQDPPEVIQQKRVRILNPVIDWSTAEVWEFIKTQEVKYCGLYDEGFTRLGCIGCPLGGPKEQAEAFRRWPKYKENYIASFDRMLIARRRDGLKVSNWTDGADVFEWWLGGEE